MQDTSPTEEDTFDVGRLTLIMLGIFGAALAALPTNPNIAVAILIVAPALLMLWMAFSASFRRHGRI